MNRIAGLVAWLISLQLTLAQEPLVETQPVDEAHRAMLHTFHVALGELESRRVAELAQAGRVFEQSLRAEMKRLAAHLEREQLQVLRGVVAGWFGADGSVEIGAEVPVELGEVVAGYQQLQDNIAGRLADGRQLEVRRLMGQLELLASGYSGTDDGAVAATQLRAQAQKLWDREVTGWRWGDLEVKEVHWSAGGAPFTRMQARGDALLTVSRLRGTMAGGGEAVIIGGHADDGTLGLVAKSLQPDVEASALSLKHPRLDVANWKVRTEQMFNTDGRKKLIHQSRGFCYLAGVWGYYGELTSCEVAIDPEDGFYYLSGRCEHESASARAVVVEFAEGAPPPAFEISHARWSRGDAIVELIDAREGVCLLSGLRGAFHGPDEEINLAIGTDGKWRLGGRSKLIGTGAQVLVLRFSG